MDNYTTNELVAKDKDGIELKKTIISNDTYAIVETLIKLIRALERL